MTSQEIGAPTTGGLKRLGTVISGRYLIRELLGEGGMGAVYLAEHTHMKKRVAIKLLHPEMSDNPELHARFEREAMAAAHIEHPNVAAATDFGKTADGAYFLVLEYVEGTSLRAALASGPLPVSRALRIARQMALALERAHEAGLVHRDLKPENVMLVKREKEPDFVKVLDFGVAKVLELGAAASESANVTRRNNSGQPITRLGTILGTPEYMAPEQALGEAVTPAADLYGVGIMLYEMLTGVLPFEPPDRAAMLSFHIVAPVPPMRERARDVDVPPTVEAVVRCLLAKDSKKRYANARSLVEAIDKAASVSGLDLGVRGAVSPFSKAASREEAREPGWASSDAFAQTAVFAPAGSSAPAIVSRGSQGTSTPSPSAATNERASEHGAVRTSLTETLRAQPRGVLVALAAALPVGFVLVVLVAFLASRGSKSPDASRTPPNEGEERGESPLPKLAPDARVKAAVALGPEALEALAKEFPRDPSLSTKLAVAYQSRGRAADALQALRARLATDPSAAEDDEIAVLVATIATKGKAENDDEAFALLEGPLGERGVDTLIDLATRTPGREMRDLRARAARSLAKPEVRAQASPAAAVLLDLKAATTCTAKRELLARAKEAGDGRLLPALKPMRNGRGCGFLGRGDCWSCLRRDDALTDAIATIEARTTMPPPAPSK